MKTMFFLLALMLGLGHSLSPQSEPRLDMSVRIDFFAGLAGDETRLRKAMELCERTLAGNPEHAEALVWHGAGLVFQSGQAFMAGDRTKGIAFWERGLKEMGDAVSLEPGNVAVLVPRSAALLEATKHVPNETARPLIEIAVKGYEQVLAIQTPIFARLGDHPKGELLFGLADGYYRLGDLDKARRYFERIVTDAPGSGQVAKANQWLTTGTIPKTNGPSCVGCHKE